MYKSIADAPNFTVDVSHDHYPSSFHQLGGALKAFEILVYKILLSPIREITKCPKALPSQERATSDRDLTRL